MIVSCSLNSEDKLDLGVFFYDEVLYPGVEAVLNKGVRHYQFRLAIVGRNPSWDHILEPITFVANVDLKDLPLEYRRLYPFDPEDKTTFTDIDWPRFVQQYAPEELKIAKDRLARRISTEEVQPRLNSDSSYLPDLEFLEFTDDTAHNWAGPFGLGTLKGCAAKITNRLHGKQTKQKWPNTNVRTNWNRCDIPYTSKEKSPDWEAPKAERAQLFDKLEPKTQLTVIKNYLRRMSELETLGEYIPWRLRLCGNDDCSYTKWFFTEEEAIEELKYLRRMQPLDFNLDIDKRDYTFTN